MAVNNLGGGGCPAYDILVEDLPFDFLQPRMERQVTQAGYGGPFVVRGNPIGAIFDAIRAFCFPAPMQASSDGSQYTDLSGYGTDTYGGYTQSDLGSLGVGGGYFPTTNPYMPSGSQCGTGTTYDYSLQQCVPTMTGVSGGGTTPTPSNPTPGGCSVVGCGPDCLEYVSAAMQDACAKNDLTTLTALIVRAKTCQAVTSADSALSGNWGKLASDAKIWAGYLAQGKLCTGQPRPAMPTPTPTTPTTSGGTTPANPASPAQGNPAAGNAGGLSYLPPMAGNPANSVIPPTSGTVTNPPMNQPPTTMISSAINAPQAGFFSLPEMPNPMSFTEGNIYMMPASEVMGGSYDPSRIGNFGTVPVSPVVRVRRAVGGARGIGVR